jgi:hypothetical protein
MFKFVRDLFMAAVCCGKVLRRDDRADGAGDIGDEIWINESP